MALPRNYLRRRDWRRRVMLDALIECRGATQKVRVTDFSGSGLRIDDIQGLAAGDPVRINFTPDLALEGEIAWAIWHKAGVKLRESLASADPVYLFLVEQAEAIERAQAQALAAVARDRAGR